MAELKTYLQHAALAARIIQQVMINDLGLYPPSSYTLTNWNGNVWLVAAMDTLALGGRLDAYENPNVVHQLSTALSTAFNTRLAIPVIMANHTGLRYCMLFGKRPTLPKKVFFPAKGYHGLVVNATSEAEAKTAFLNYLKKLHAPDVCLDYGDLKQVITQPVSHIIDVKWIGKE